MGSEPENKEPGKAQPVAGRIPTGQERERALRAIKQEMIPAATAPTAFSPGELRMRDVLAALRKAGKKPIKPFDS